MNICHLDHLVMTVINLDDSVYFYSEILGMQHIVFGENNERHAVLFGHQKINFHLKDHEFEPKAITPIPGSLDLCFITDTPLNEVIEQLNAHKIKIIEGPVERTGAVGKICSIYIRDPSLNLIEIANYLS